MGEGQARRDTGRFRERCALAALGVALLAGPAAAAPPVCTVWPGEPKPLPRLGDPDPLRAHWATLRVRELSAAARAIEADDPARAHALWQHARCIAPEDPEVVGRTDEPVPSVIVHRPELVRGELVRAPEDAWASLAAPIALAGPAPAPRREASPAPRSSAGGSKTRSAAAAPDTARVDALVAETAGHVSAASFEAALASAEKARQAVARLPRSARSARTARLEVAAATAALALGRDDEAKASLARALAADPNLRLDPGSTPPKVVRALEAARAERAR